MRDMELRNTKRRGSTRLGKCQLRVLGQGGDNDSKSHGYSLILMDRESQRVAKDREWLAVYDLSTVGPVVGNAASFQELYQLARQG
jgi:hypothetical protein